MEQEDYLLTQDIGHTAIKKEDSIFKKNLPNENIVNDLCDGYGKCWCAGWMRDEVGLKGRSI